MKIVGILTEFNPFHSGHAYLLRQVREMAGEDAAIVCVMSGNFVQRGEPALLEKHVRAEAALRCGADVILELPVARALSSAEGFARGAMELMQSTGCITHLAFGSECGDVTRLERLAACLDSADYGAALRRFLKEGGSFAACRQAAVRAVLGEDAALLDGANNSLGAEYLKAARQLGWDCEAITVPRRGAAHDSREAGEYLSATALRAILTARRWEEAEQFIPEAAMTLYRAAFEAGRGPISLSPAERAILARLRTMEKADFAALPDCNEGLEHRLYRAARQAGTVEEFLMLTKTKRYTLSRLRRMMMCAWLEIDAAAAAERPQYLRVLGCTARGRKVLAQMRKDAALPILVKGADVRKLSPAAQRQFEREARATERYVLLYPDLVQAAPGQEWRINPVVIGDEKTEGIGR